MSELGNVIQFPKKRAESFEIEGLKATSSAKFLDTVSVQVGESVQQNFLSSATHSVLNNQEALFGLDVFQIILEGKTEKLGVFTDQVLGQFEKDLEDLWFLSETKSFFEKLKNWQKSLAKNINEDVVASQDLYLLNEFLYPIWKKSSQASSFAEQVKFFYQESVNKLPTSFWNG